MKKARANISGRFPEDLESLDRPFAWSGTVSQADREAAEREVRALREEVRQALEAGAEGVFVQAGRILWVWDWQTIEVLREQAEKQGREDLAQICDEVLAAEEAISESHRRSIWDALEEGEVC